MTFRNAVVVQLLQKGFANNLNKMSESHLAKNLVSESLAAEIQSDETKV